MAENTQVNEEGTPAAQTITTKSAMMSGILAAMASMSHEQMMQWFPDAMALAGDIPNGIAAQNQASIAMKPTVKEDAASLFSGGDLAEEARDKVLTLIEHAVSTQVAVETARLEEEFQGRLVEETAQIQEQVVEKVDAYVTYAAEQWIEKNDVAIESAMKVEKAERLIAGLTQLLGECNIEISEEKVDVVNTLEEEVKELRAKLDEQVEDAIGIREELIAARALLVFKEVAEGLTLLDAEKLKKLVEDVDIDEDMDELKKKLTIIRDAHFRADRQQVSEEAAAGLTKEQTPVETLTEETAPATVDPQVQRYADAISRASTTRYARGPFAR